jgi:hypothetical protein
MKDSRRSSPFLAPHQSEEWGPSNPFCVGEIHRVWVLCQRYLWASPRGFHRLLVLLLSHQTVIASLPCQPSSWRLWCPPPPCSGCPQLWHRDILSPLQWQPSAVTSPDSFYPSPTPALVATSSPSPSSLGLSCWSLRRQRERDERGLVLLLFPSPYVIAHTFTKREEREREMGAAKLLLLFPSLSVIAHPF